MSVNCAYHPDRAALSSCVECSTPICRECETLVKGKPVCQRCVANIRSKVESELGPQPAPAASPYGTPPSVYGAPAGTPYSANPGAQGTMYTPPSPIVEEEPSPARFVGGIVAGAVVALIGSIIWEKIYVNAHFMLAWAYILIGGGTGAAVATVGRRSGFLPAIVSALLYTGGMLVGHWMLVQDALKKELPGLDITINWDDFMEIMKNLGGLHWIFVAIGVIVAFSAAFKEPGSE